MEMCSFLGQPVGTYLVNSMYITVFLFDCYDYFTLYKARIKNSDL